MYKHWITIFALVVFMCAFTFSQPAEKNLYSPIENFILDTTHVSVVLKIYEISDSMRVARILPFNWYLLNENNNIFFLLDNGIGKTCAMFYSPAVIYHGEYDFKYEAKIECVNPSISQLELLTKSLPFEQISHTPDNTKDNQVVEIIKYLLINGLFTFTQHLIPPNGTT